MQSLSPALYKSQDSLPSINFERDNEQNALEKIAQVFQCNIPLESSEQAMGALFDVVYDACSKRDWKRLEEVRKEIKVVRNNWQKTVLMDMVIRWENELASEMIEHKVLLHETDSEGNTALHIAAEQGNVYLIPKLSQHLNLEAKNNKGETPLLIATKSGQEAIVAHLLSQRANQNQQFRVHPESSLQLNVLEFAVMLGQASCVDLLITNRGRKFRSSSIGNLLHLAIHFHQPEMVKHLLKEHREIITPLIEERDAEGRTPLALAAYLGETESIDFLYEAKASLDAEDLSGRCPIHQAALGCQHEAIQLLSFLGAKLNTTDVDNKRPIDLIPEPKTDEATSCHNLLTNLSRDKALAKRAPMTQWMFPENLVFRGGGPKGLAYGGVLLELAKKGILAKVTRVAGSSAGAITAGLLAVGYSAEEILGILEETDFMQFLDYPLSRSRLNEARVEPSLLSRLQRILVTCKRGVQAIQAPHKLVTEPLKALWHLTGVCEGSIALDWLENLIRTQSEISHLTLGELNQLIKSGKPYKHLHIFGTKVGKNPEIVHFSSEDPACANYIISDLLRISMSIPGVFKPHVIHIKQGGQRIPAPQLGSFLDGGMLNNFPIETFDQKKYQTREELEPEEGSYPRFNRRTLGFSLYSSLQPQPQNSEIETIADLLTGICGVYLEAETLIRQRNPYNAYRVIEIDVKDVGTLSFSLSKDKKNELVASGQQATSSFLNNHSPSVEEGSEQRFKKKIHHQLALPGVLPYFIERQKPMQQIHDRLLPNDREGSSPTTICPLQGMGGVGKSELAIAFANRYLEDFSLVWTIPCETDESYYSAYRTLATESLNIHLENETPEEVVNKVHRVLSNSKFDKPWLLILDNVEKPRTTPERGGAVLITTQKRFPNSLELTSFEDKESLSLFKKILYPSTYTDESLSEVAKALDHSPQLLAVAAHYMRETNCSPEEYLKRLNNIHPLEEQQENGRYPRALIQTIALSLDLLAENAPTGRAWLSIGAYLDADSISFAFIENWLKQSNKDVSKIEEERRQITRSLTGRSLARIHDKNNSLTLHRTLQAALQIIHKKDDTENQHYTQAVLLTMDWMELYNADKPESWPAAEEAMVHTTLLCRHPLWKQLPWEKRYAFHLKAANFMRIVQGDMESALTQGLQALELAREAIAPLLIAESYIEIGTSLRALGRYEEALQHLRQPSILLSENDHPEKNADFLDVIGWIRYDLGHHDEALRLRKKTLKIRRKVFASPHPKIALSLNDIGSSLLALKRTEEALEEYTKALTMRRELFGEEHLEFAKSLNNMGMCLAKSGRVQEVLNYYNQSLQITQKLLGEHHPEVARCYNNIAIACMDLSRFDEAMNFRDQAFNLYIDLFGEHHPDVLRTRKVKRMILEKSGRTEEFLAELKHNLEIAEQRCIDSPDSDLVEILAKLCHAIGLEEQEKLEYAEKLFNFSEKLTGGERKLSLNILGSSSYTLGNYEDALAYWTSLKIYHDERSFGVELNAEQLLCLENNLGATLEELGRWDEALEHFTVSLLIGCQGGLANDPILSICLNNFVRACNHRSISKEKRNQVKDQLLLLLEETFGANHAAIQKLKKGDKSCAVM